MRIALCSSYVPFVLGGARNIVEWLDECLREAGHEVERVYLPQVDAPDRLFQQMAAYRWVDVGSADRLICFRPPAHFIPHPNKILWFIHHIRTFYDLWDTQYRNFPDNAHNRGIRDGLRAADTVALGEARHVFTNSAIVSDRLRRFNGIDSEVLYPPLFQPERFHCNPANNEIVCIARVEQHKRQLLLVEAMRFTHSDVRLRICGSSTNGDYAWQLRTTIRSAGLSDRVTFDERWISEAEKVEILADSLAAAYLPLDEDSYGYSSLEAAHSRKAVLTTTDSGGVLELVQDMVSGFVVPPDPQAIGDAMDRLFLDKGRTRTMGENARTRVDELEISWPHVLERLLA